MHWAFNSYLKSNLVCHIKSNIQFLSFFFLPDENKPDWHQAYQPSLLSPSSSFVSTTHLRSNPYSGLVGHEPAGAPTYSFHPHYHMFPAQQFLAKLSELVPSPSSGSLLDCRNDSNNNMHMGNILSTSIESLRMRARHHDSMLSPRDMS